MIALAGILQSVFSLKPSSAAAAATPAATATYNNRANSPQPELPTPENPATVMTTTMPPLTAFRKSRITSTPAARKKHHGLSYHQIASANTASAAGDAAGSAHSVSSVNIKIAVVSSPSTRGVGKSQLTARFLHDRFQHEYSPSSRVQWEEKRIRLKRGTANLALCDVATADARDRNLLYLACGDAQCVLFCFDLTRRASLTELRDVYASVQQVNPRVRPSTGTNNSSTKPVVVVLVGCKYDAFDGMDEKYRQDMVQLARQYALAMRASALVFTSSKESINVMKLFKIVVGAVSDIECYVEPRVALGEPIIEY